jgi:hypothetical protein
VIRFRRVKAKESRGGRGNNLYKIIAYKCQLEGAASRQTPTKALIMIPSAHVGVERELAGG